MILFLTALLACDGTTDGPLQTETKATPEATLAQITYPESRRGTTTDTLHGTEVADPYRWLEDPNEAGYQDWITAQNALTSQWIGAVEDRGAISERLTELWAYESYGVPRKHGERLFFTYRAVGADQPVITVREGTEDRVLLDVASLSDDGTVSLNTWSVSEDGRYLAYGISDGGSDWVTFKVRDVETGEDLEDELSWVKFSDAAWAPDGSGFWYSRYPAPKSELEDMNTFHKLYFHRIGTSQAEDTLVFENPDAPQQGFGAEATKDGRYLVITVWEGTEEKSRVYLQCLLSGDCPLQPGQTNKLLDAFDANYQVLDVTGPLALLKTDRDAPRGRIARVPIDPRAGEPPLQTVVPEHETDTLQTAAVIGGRLVLGYLHDARSVLRIYDIPATGEATLQHEVALPGVGTVGGLRGPSREKQTWVRFTSFTTPTGIYSLDVEKGTLSPYESPEVPFDPADFVTEQVFYTSKDGTQIPLFITRKKGVEKGTNAPTLLYGYGGFNIPITPSFKADRIVWMERGGIYASANLRGGGEYGRSWHEAGTREHKQNVFDDFAAAAEYLHREGWTTPQRTAIQGRSNGGLLVGATMLQRPELFGAAQPGVGVLDMLRYHKFTIGWAWEPDYGIADDAEMFPHLLAYSPVHNCKSDASYPATLITTGDHDDRVVPAHSFKFAAALQHSQGGTAPVEAPALIRIDTRAGHGAGKSVSMQIEETADVLAFFERALRD